MSGTVKESDTAKLSTAGGEVLFQSSLSEDEDAAKQFHKVSVERDALTAALHESVESVSKKESSYRAVLGAVTGSVPAKTLAAQTIPQFFKHFPSLHDEAMDAQLDLCEDESLNIRMTAIKHLPKLSLGDADLVPKLADVLGQLLLRADKQEVGCAENALLELVPLNPQGVVAALLHQIINLDEDSEDEAPRTAAMNFFRDRVVPRFKNVLSDDAVEAVLVEHIPQTLAVVGEEDFKFLLRILGSTKEYSNEEGNKKIVDVIFNQAETNSFSLGNDVSVTRVLSCMDIANGYYKKGANSSKFSLFVVEKVFPHIMKDEGISQQTKYSLLKRFAELAPHMTNADCVTAIGPVVELLKSFLPIEMTGKPNFSFIEVILFIFHIVAGTVPLQLNDLIGYRKLTGQPSDLLESGNEELWKDFQKRVSGGLAEMKKYVSQLQRSLQLYGTDLAKATEDSVKEELKTKRDRVTKGLRLVKSSELMLEPLAATEPLFLKAERMSPSWIEGGQKKRKMPSTQQKLPEKRQRRVPKGVYRPPRRGRWRGRGRRW